MLKLMKIVLVALFLAFLPKFVFGQPQNEWVVKYDPNMQDSAEATNCNCHVYTQRDGQIRLSAFVPDFNPNIKGFSGGMYHNLTLSPSGTAMVVTLELWTPRRHTDIGSVEGYQGPDLFWQTCGRELPSLPPDILKSFKGYRGLPLPQ